MTEDNQAKEEPETQLEQIVPWTPDHEGILIEWADKAMCYRWLHAHSHASYRRANAWFTIPVIVMSTITGTANFAQERFGDDIKPYIAMAVGGVNIFAGILTTIAQFLKIGELNEAHRVSSISWDKFYRNIKVELAKAPKERVPVLQMLKIAKEEFDRLMETSPSVAEKVIYKFQSTFEGKSSASIWRCGKATEAVAADERRKAAFQALKKPEICDSLESTRASVYKRRVPHEVELARAAAIPGARAAAAADDMTTQIRNIITDFTRQRGRQPTNEEIQDELGKTVEASTISEARASSQADSAVQLSIE